MNIVRSMMILFSFSILCNCTNKCITIKSNNNHQKSFGQFYVIRKEANVISKNGILVSSITVKNKKSSSASFQYQVNWKDKNNFIVGQTQPWIPIQVKGSLEKDIKIVAPNVTATGYSINLCELDID